MERTLELVPSALTRGEVGLNGHQCGSVKYHQSVHHYHITTTSPPHHHHQSTTTTTITSPPPLPIHRHYHITTTTTSPPPLPHHQSTTSSPLPVIIATNPTNSVCNPITGRQDTPPHNGFIRLIQINFAS